MANEKEKKDVRIRILVNSIFIELSALIVICLLVKYLPISSGWRLLVEIGGVLFLVLIPFLLIYFKWAKNNLNSTFVSEGTAKVIVKGGEVVGMLIQWKGRTFDREWNVIEGDDGRHPFGGLRFYGIWPVYDIYLYRLRWTNLHADGTPAEHDEILDSVMLKDMVYYMEIDGAEDEDKIPLKIGLLLTLRIINPYKALFKGQDWMELLNRMQPLFREHVAGVAFENLIKERQKVGGDLWKKLNEEGLIQEFEDDYGIGFKEGGIEMKDITPPPDYQKAATQRYLAEREAEKRAGETIGAVLNMMAMATGRTRKEVQAQINKNTRLRKEFREFCQDLIHRKMAIDGKSYLDIRVTGAEGAEKSLLELIAAWKRIPQPEKVGEKPEKKTKKEAGEEEDN